MISRRQLLAIAGAAPAWLASRAKAAPAANLKRLGGAPTAFSIRQRSARGAGQPFDMLEHYHFLGLGGGQLTPPSMEPEAIRKFREKIEAYGMYVICDARLPRTEAEVAAYEAQVKAYKEAGAVAFHAAMTGRRYEEMNSLEQFRTSFEQSQKSVQLAEPILRKHRMRLGIENHKGWRSAEQAAWLKRVGSEWVGVCLDFGNNVSLCEDPMDTLRNLAPFTFFAHIKDMAVEEYEDGFLLSEVALGEGFLDLKKMVQTLREKDPNFVFELEMITRDPLKVPVFTPKYWVTFEDAYSPLPGRDLAKTLSLVKKNRPKSPLPRITGLNPEAQVKLEDDYNMKCITYAHQNLDM